MNRQQLYDKFNELKAAAKVALDNATKALNDGDTAKFDQLHNDAETMVKQANAYKAQIIALDELATTDVPDAPAVTEQVTKSEPVRLPFEAQTDDTQQASSPAKSTQREPIYVLKYGEMDVATKAVLADLYGNDYDNQRSKQMVAFKTFIRGGARHLNLEQEKLLKTLLLLPESVASLLKADESVKAIKATLQEGVNDLGGFLAPEEYRMDLLRRIAQLSAIRRYARVVNTSRGSVEWPKLDGGNDRYTSAVRVTWVDELPSNAAGAETNPTFGMTRVPINTVMARTDVGKNMLEDSAFDVTSLIAELFAEALAIDEGNQFATGMGGNVPLGILGDRQNGTQPAPVTGIDAVVTGNATDITADGLIDLVYELPQQYRANAIIMGARLTHRNIRKLKDGTGNYLWERNLQVGQPPNILGVPFYEEESLPGIAANSHPLIHGDFRGYLIADRVGMSFDRVEDTTTAGQNKVAFFMRRRLGARVVEPWRLNVQKVSS